MSATIKDSLVIWALLLVGVFLISFVAGLRITAALAFSSLIALIALTTFYPVTNFSSIMDATSEVRMYFVILVVTVAYLFLYLCNKILADKRYVYFYKR